MNAPDTLTRRVIWATTATVALFVGLVAVLATSVMLEQEDELADQVVDLEMRRLIARLDRSDQASADQPIELGPGIQGWVETDDVDRAMPVELRGLVGGPHEIHTGSRVIHVLTADSRHGRITVVFDATRNEQRVSEFGLILLSLWVMCVFAGYWLARATARMVVGPMREVTERIAGWDPDLAHTAEVPVDRGDEAGRLLEAFNRMQDRVDRSIAREREFAANLGHEVRTPLAALRTDIEMSALDARIDDEQRRRHQRMLRSIDDIGATIAAARALSRSQAMPERRTIVLAALVDEVWDSLRARAGAAGLQLSNEVGPEVELFVDRYALLIVLRNLVANAIEHAAPATLTVRARSGSIEVSDDGPGIDAADLPFVFDRHHSGRLRDEKDPASAATGDGDAPRGLGLAIARRICNQHGWLLGVDSATSGDHHGTRFSLQFDENST